MAFVKIVEGGRPDQSIAVRNEHVVLGRQDDCDIILDAKPVSRQHAEIRQRDGRFFLKDLNSRNRTFLNGAKVTAARELREGDTIKICDFVMSFHLSETPPEDSPVYVAPLKDDQRDRDNTKAAQTKAANARAASAKTVPDSSQVIADDGSAVLFRLSVDSDSNVTRAHENPEVKLRAVLQFSKVLGESMRLGGLLPAIVEGLFDVFTKADSACVLLLDGDSDTLSIGAGKHRRRPSPAPEAPSISVARLAINAGEAILSGDAEHDTRFQSMDSVRTKGIRSILCVPLVTKSSGILGAVQVATDALFDPFVEEDLDVLTSVALQVTLALQNAHLHKSVEQRVEELTAIHAALVRSNEDLQQFAFAASHDLQEPLRTVIGFCELLHSHTAGKLDATALEYIEEAVSGSKRMRQLIEELLMFSRVETRGKAFRETDLNEVMSVVLANLGAAVAESAAVITHDPLPTVLSDSSQMVQLLQNLIGNAIKFRGPREPRIHVSSRDAADHWTISVRDNGIGIEERQFDRIFVIFQRLHTRRQYDGTGMGLSICKRIAERHGGRIWVESKPDKGSTFLFTLAKAIA